MPLLGRERGDENKPAKGGYVLQEAEGGERKLTILSTGSELHLAVQARELLQKEGIPTAVVSMPCRLLFEQQDAAFRKKVLGTARARVAVEAAVELGWDRYTVLKAASSGCTRSALRERSTTSTRNWTSTPKRWCEPHMRRWPMLQLCERRSHIGL
jgi:transketolase